MLDSTPLLDIKPFVPDFDFPAGKIETGWLEHNKHKAATAKSDNRFADNLSKT